MLAKATSDDPILLHVSSEQPPLSRLAELYALADPIHNRGLNARLRTVHGSAPQMICQEACRRHARWVIMGTRGRNNLSGPQTGSVARTVMKTCKRPVLAIRPGPGDEVPKTRSILPDFSRCDPGVILLSITSRPFAAAVAVAEMLARSRDGQVERRHIPAGWRGEMASWVELLDRDNRIIVVAYDPFQPCSPGLEDLLRAGANPVVLVSRGNAV